jgi:hypothetical protein
MKFNLLKTHNLSSAHATPTSTITTIMFPSSTTTCSASAAMILTLTSSRLAAYIGKKLVLSLNITENVVYFRPHSLNVVYFIN